MHRAGLQQPPSPQRPARGVQQLHLAGDGVIAFTPKGHSPFGVRGIRFEPRIFVCVAHKAACGPRTR